MSFRRPDASTLRQAARLLLQVRNRGIGWALRQLMSHLGAPSKAPGKVARLTIALAKIGGFRVVNRISRPIFGQGDAVFVFYDFAKSPVTYDFCWALIGGEQMRQAKGLESVNVVFVPGELQGFRLEDDAYEAVVPLEARRWRLDNILLPLCRLLPELNSVHLCATRREAAVIELLQAKHVFPPQYSTAFPIAHHPKMVLLGDKVPMPFRASEHALGLIDRWLQDKLHGRKLVTITLRQYNYMPARNSNLKAWSEFAKRLDPDKFFAVVIPDTDSIPDEVPAELSGITVFREPALNLACRMALYQRAYLNMLVNSGPYAMCMFSRDVRYLMFKILTDVVPQATPAYVRYLGFRIGETPAFAGPYQKWVWEDDSLECIEREFHDMCAAISIGGDTCPGL